MMAVYGTVIARFMAIIYSLIHMAIRTITLLELFRAAAGLALFMAFGTAVSADTLREGLDAYRAGNYPQAFRLLKSSAAGGDPDAQNHLGLMLANGQGVVRDDASAAYWFRRAAEFGHGRAQRNLDFLVANGRARPPAADEPECR